jgi:phenylalanine-4-hydroxylase
VLYQQVREKRNSLAPIFETTKQSQRDWLLQKIVELLKERRFTIGQNTYISRRTKKKRPEVAHLISGGLDLIFVSEV